MLKYQIGWLLAYVDILEKSGDSFEDRMREISDWIEHTSQRCVYFAEAQLEHYWMKEWNEF